MDRQQMISLVRAVADKEFASEVNYFVHGIDEREYGYDEVSALFDILDRSEQAIADYDDPKLKRESRRLLKVARETCIAIGFYRVMPQEEIDNTYTSSTRAPWTFKLKGVAYTSDDPADDWQWPKEN